MDNIASSHVRAQFEALLLEPLLKPLESAFGEYGEVAAESFTDVLSRASSLPDSSW